jgi:hypothetical protein
MDSAFGQSGRFAIGGRRRGEHHAFYFVIARGHQNIQRAIDIDLIGFDGIFHGTRHRGACCQMNHEFRLMHGLLHRFNVGDRALHEGDFAAHLGQVFFFAR